MLIKYEGSRLFSSSFRLKDDNFGNRHHLPMTAACLLGYMSKAHWVSSEPQGDLGAPGDQDA